MVLVECCIFCVYRLVIERRGAVLYLSNRLSVPIMMSCSDTYLVSNELEKEISEMQFNWDADTSTENCHHLLKKIGFHRRWIWARFCMFKNPKTCPCKQFNPETWLR